MLPDKMEHCIVFMNSWDVSDVFWSFSKCNITIPHFPTVPSTRDSFAPWGATVPHTPVRSEWAGAHLKFCERGVREP